MKKNKQILIAIMILIASSCAKEKVDKIMVKSIELSVDKNSLEIGEYLKIDLKIIPTIATDTTVTWCSSDTSIVTVNNGLVKGIKAGSADISAKANDGSKVFSKLSLMVKEKLIIIEIMPIKEGNTWTYLNTNHSYNTINTSIIEIGKELSISGHKGNLFGTSYLLRSDEQGNTIQVGAFSEHDTVFSESLLYKKSIIKGESFDYHMIISSSNSLNFEERTVVKTCTNIDTLISTSAGDFKCIVFEHTPDNGGNVFRDYMCVNVGRIKSERFEDGKLFSTSVLIEYNLK